MSRFGANAGFVDPKIPDRTDDGVPRFANRHRQSGAIQPMGTDNCLYCRSRIRRVSSPELLVDAVSTDVTCETRSTASQDDVAEFDTKPQRTDGIIRLAPPPPGSETPARRVLRLGDAPESPIHSENPEDWEDVQMPSGDVWLVPRGLPAMGDREFAVCHLRKGVPSRHVARSSRSRRLG